MGKSSSAQDSITSSKAGGPLPPSTKLPCAEIAGSGKDILSRGSPVATDGLPGWTLTVCLMIGQTHLNSDAVLG